MSLIGQMRMRAATFRVVASTPAKSMLVSYIVGCALFMGALDASIVAAALPAMATALHADPLDMSIVITTYLLSMIMTIPATAWLADRFGARTLFFSGVALFTISSLACGLAVSLPSLVAARLLQGVGAGLTATVGRILVLRSTDKSAFVNALSYLAVPALIAPMIGPPLGGFIIVHGSWRYIFLLNVPVGVITLLVAAPLIKGGNDRYTKPFDCKGFLLASGGLACLVFGLESLSRADSARGLTTILLVGGIAAVLAYVLHARKHPHPILALDLLRIPTFFIAVVGGNLCRLSLGAMPFLLMLLLQIGFGLDALQAGSIVFATALGSLTVKFVVSRVVRRFGFRRALLANSLFCGALIMSCALLQTTVPHAVVAFALLAIGFFRSLHLTLANTLGYADVPQQEMGEATSMATTAQYLAMAAGVSLAVFVMRISTALHGSVQLVEHDIDAALVVVGALFACSSLLFRRLQHDAGAKLAPPGESAAKSK